VIVRDIKLDVVILFPPFFFSQPVSIYQLRAITVTFWKPWFPGRVTPWSLTVPVVLEESYQERSPETICLSGRGPYLPVVSKSPGGRYDCCALRLDYTPSHSPALAAPLQGSPTIACIFICAAAALPFLTVASGPEQSMSLLITLRRAEF